METSDLPKVQEAQDSAFCLRVTPLKTNMEPKNCWFVEVSPFAKGLLSGSMLVFGGVRIFSRYPLHHRLGVFVWGPSKQSPSGLK